MPKNELIDIIRRKHLWNVRARIFSIACTYLLWGMVPAAFAGFFCVAGLFGWIWLILFFMLGLIAGLFFARRPVERLLPHTARILDRKSMLPGGICSSLVSIDDDYNNNSKLKDEFLAGTAQYCKKINGIKIPFIENSFRYLIIPVVLLFIQFLIFQANKANYGGYSYSSMNSGVSISVTDVDPELLDKAVAGKISIEELAAKTGKSPEELQTMLDEALRERDRKNNEKSKGAGFAKTASAKGNDVELYSGKIKFSEKEVNPAVRQGGTYSYNSESYIPPAYREGVQEYLKAVAKSVQP